MHPVSCTNTHHAVTDLVNHGMVKKKLEYLENKAKLFYKIKNGALCTCKSDLYLR